MVSSAGRQGTRRGTRVWVPPAGRSATLEQVITKPGRGTGACLCPVGWGEAREADRAGWRSGTAVRAAPRPVWDGHVRPPAMRSWWERERAERRARCLRGLVSVARAPPQHAKGSTVSSAGWRRARPVTDSASVRYATRATRSGSAAVGLGPRWSAADGARTVLRRQRNSTRSPAFPAQSGSPPGEQRPRVRRRVWWFDDWDHAERGVFRELEERSGLAARCPRVRHPRRRVG